MLVPAITYVIMALNSFLCSLAFLSLQVNKTEKLSHTKKQKKSTVCPKYVPVSDNLMLQIYLLLLQSTDSDVLPRMLNKCLLLHHLSDFVEHPPCTSLCFCYSKQCHIQTKASI